MATEMGKIKATANAHMQRDIQAGRKWICVCDHCREMRSLVGMEKLLQVRPLVREIEEIEGQLQGLPDGPAMHDLMRRYMTLYDKLAEAVAQ